MGASYLGPQDYRIGPAPGTYITEQPEGARSHRRGTDNVPLDARAKWARRMESTLKRERQTKTEGMKRSQNLFRGGTPWWKVRPKWRIGTRLNFCAWVPQQWTAVLTDNNPSVAYTAKRTHEQRLADISQAAFYDAFDTQEWAQVIHDAVLLSRIEGKAYLRLTYNSFRDEAQLTEISGQQVWMNRSASGVDDAEVLLYEYRESVASLCARFKKHRKEIERLAFGEDERGERKVSDDADTLITPPTYFTSPTTGQTTFESPYETTASAPSQDGGTGGLLVHEYWTRPKRTIGIEEVLFTAANAPATRKKYIEFEDGRRELLKIVVTEGNVIYELPASTTAYLQYAGDVLGGVKILETYDAVEVVKHTVDYPLYPEGRLLTLIERRLPVEDSMSPMDYWPFIEIDAYRDPTHYIGWGDIEYIYDLQEQLVRLVSLLFDAAMLTSNPIWRLPLESDLADEDITNAPGAVMREDPISLKLGRREPGPDMPQYVMALVQFCIAEIKELSGLTDTATGGKFKGQQAAETVSMYQEAAGVRFRESMHNLERSMSKLGRQFILMMRQFYTQPRMVQIKKQTGVREPVTFFGAQVANISMRVEAKAGSQMPQSPSARLNAMINLMNAPKPILDLPELWGLLQEVGLIDSATALEDRIERELHNPKDQWKVLGLPAPQGQSKGGSAKKPRSARNKGTQSAL